MTIQWFPGHMTKAKRMVEENLRRVDIILELLDARVPAASRNPLISELTLGKPRLILLNKSDLADVKETDRWVNHFKATQDIQAMPIEAMREHGVKKIEGAVRKVVDAHRKENGQRPLDRRYRAMAVGIPNVGKSSLINRLAMRKIARTGDEPAVTRKAQWVRMSKEMELLDMPGILWHKFEDQRVGAYLAATGAIKDAVIDIHDIACFAIQTLGRIDPEHIKGRYKLKELNEDPRITLEDIGRKRGCLRPGGVVDVEKAGQLVIRELRGGKLGRITLQTVAAFEDELRFARDEYHNN
ncbi:MAG: ribosome biogenesis GTPase YlqF [Deltaproteobacteria bacterium]|jgi:ribosome biogenesis GTPase A|nr:ribosome biogenesis GTPase YlqF [Deltaproteobacteria bacterium]MBT6434983.1 ribosome biogenesis GTPase YlqF [Deltaproteobacteria bacterium]